MRKHFLIRMSLINALVLLAVSASVFADDGLNKLISEKKFNEALQYADAQLPPASRDAATWVVIARANEGLGYMEKALACNLVAWRIDSRNYDAVLGAAKIYNKLEQPDNAINMANKALEINFTAEASWEYARACIKLNRAADAKKALEKIIETDPSNTIANRELGIIYFGDKSYGKAIVLLQKAYEAQADATIAYDLGKSFLEVSNAPSAITYLKLALEKNPALADASLDLARAYSKNGQYADAAAAFEKLASQPGLSAADAYLLAVAYENLNKTSDAATAWQAVVAKYGTAVTPEAITAHLKVGNAQLDRKKFAEALVQFQFIVAADPSANKVPNIYFLLADAYVGSGNPIKAIQSLEKAITLDSKNVEAYARLADLYAQSPTPEKAHQIYEKMMELSPNDPHVFEVLGEYNLKAKKYTDALSHYERSYGLKQTASTAEGGALSAAALSQWDKARDAAISAVKLDPARVDARSVLVKIFGKDKNYAAQREHLEYLSAKRPNDMELLKQLTVCYAGLGDAAKLAETDKKIADLDKTNIESRSRLALYALSQNNTQLAIAMYKDLSVLTPQNADVFKKLYELYMQSSDKVNAASSLKKYVALNPADAPAQKNLGDVLYDTKDADGALAAYRAVIRLDPKIKGFYKRYAELVVAKGQQAEVIKVLSGAIASGEADAGTYMTLGMIYQKNAAYPKALEMYQKAVQVEPQNPDALSALADCQAKSGDVGAAIISYEQVVMMNPNAENEYREMGALYAAQGKTDQSIEAYRKYLVKVPSDQDIAKKTGMFLYEKKQYADALKYLELVKEKSAGDMGYQFALGESYFATNNLKNAESTFESMRLQKTLPASTLKNVLKLLAEAYEKDNNPALAADMYVAYAVLPGTKDLEASYKAAFFSEKTNPTRAKKLYEENVVAFPKDYRSFLRLGLLYAGDKQTMGKSVAMFKSASALADTIPMLWLELAQVYEKLNNTKDEIDAYKKLVALDPQHPVANKQLGLLLMKNNSVSDAMVYLVMANTVMPKDAEVLKVMGQGYVKTKRINEAIDAFEKSQVIKADDPEVSSALVELYQQTNQDAKALVQLKQLVGIKHDNKILLQYAKALLKANNIKDARDAIEDIRATEPENLEALMLVGEAMRTENKLDSAVDTYKEISYINPNFAPALYERAQVHLQQNKYQWAKTFYERTLRADPNFALAELGLAMVAKSQKNQAVYAEHLDKAMKLDPTNAAIKDEFSKSKK